MIRLDLTEGDATILINALEYYVSELRMEVADTDQKDMRDELKAEKDTLNKILGALKAGSSPA